jgi:hypothetical protein
MQRNREYVISTGFQNPTNFADSSVWFPYVFQYVLGYDEIKGVIQETEHLQVFAADPICAAHAGWHIIEIFGAYIPWQVLEDAMDCAIGLGLVYPELFQVVLHIPEG